MWILSELAGSDNPVREEIVFLADPEDSPNQTGTTGIDTP
jgi:hypothetical protein